MRDHHLRSRLCRPARGGIATLEFVMALPFLLLLMVGITWLGFSVIGQTEVLVQSRNKAWKRRFEDASKKPLYFPVLPLYDKNSDYVTEKASGRVDVSRVFSRIPGPEASHTILAGSWDFEAMSFKEPPDFKLMAIAAAVGTGGNALDWLAELTNPVGLIKKFQSFGSGIKSETERDKSNVGKDDGSTGSGSGSDPGTIPPDAKTPDQAKEDTEKKREAEKNEKLKRYKELGGRLNPYNDRIEIFGGELKQTNDEIIRLQGERAKKFLDANNEPDAEKKKKLQEELARIQRQLDLMNIKYKRLETEFRDVVAELDALGVDKWELWLRNP